MKTLRDMTEPELGELMNLMGRTIEEVARILEVERPYFALLLFNDPEIAQYAANCRREDIIVAMRECAARLEAKQDLVR